MHRVTLCIEMPRAEAENLLTALGHALGLATEFAGNDDDFRAVARLQWLIHKLGEELKGK